MKLKNRFTKIANREYPMNDQTSKMFYFRNLWLLIY